MQVIATGQAAKSVVDDHPVRGGHLSLEVPLSLVEESEVFPRDTPWQQGLGKCMIHRAEKENPLWGEQRKEANP